MPLMLLAAAAVVLTSTSFAGTPAHAETGSMPAVHDTIVVTETRPRSRLDEVLAPMMVIDRAQIERTGGVDLADVLRFQAGLEIARTGGPGQQTSVFTRGTDSNHTLILIDGVELNPGTIGGAAIQNVPLDAIERVEIVKGPRSSLYGSEAIGGVINVITRKPESDAWFSATAGGGGYDTRNLSASGGLRGEDGAFTVVAEHLKTDGFPTRVGSELDRGYDNTSLSLSGRMDIGNSLLEVRHWEANGAVEYLDFLLQPLTQNYRNATTALALDIAPVGQLRQRLRLSRTIDDVEQRENDDFVRTERDVYEWEAELDVSGPHRIVGGIAYSDEQTSGLGFGIALSDGDGDVDTDVLELWLADEILLGRHDFLFAARLTDHDSFGVHATWNAEYGLDLGNIGRFTAAAGTAFRAPDSTDRFGFGGNPSLEPEESTNFELGWRRSLTARQQLSVQLYQNSIDNLIDFQILDPVNFIGQNRNIGRARIRGVEAVWQYHSAEWNVEVGASLQDPRDRDENSRLLRRARENLNASVSHRLGAHEIGVDLAYAGDRVDFGFPAPTPLSGYLLANLTGRYQFGEHWSLRGRVENLFDEDYALAAGFRTPGRAIYLSAVFARR